MSLRPTKQLSKKASEEVREELSSPKITPASQAQQDRVKAMAAKIQKKSEAKSRPASTSR